MSARFPSSRIAVHVSGWQTSPPSESQEASNCHANFLANFPVKFRVNKERNLRISLALLLRNTVRSHADLSSNTVWYESCATNRGKLLRMWRVNGLSSIQRLRKRTSWQRQGFVGSTVKGRKRYGSSISPTLPNQDIALVLRRSIKVFGWKWQKVYKTCLNAFPRGRSKLNFSSLSCPLKCLKHGEIETLFAI